MYKRHKCELSRCNDDEGDYWCEKCYDYKYFFLYKVGKRDIESVDTYCIDIGEK